MLIPMKKATLYALKSQREEILVALQKTGEFMLLSDESDTGLPGRAEKEQDVQRIDAALKFISLHQKNKKFFEPRLEMKFDDFSSVDEETKVITQKAEELLDRMNQLKSENITLLATVQQLKPWENLDESINDVVDTTYTKIFIGFIPDDKIDDVKGALSPHCTAAYFYADGEDGRAAMVVSHNDCAEDVLPLLKENGFTEARLPKSEMTPKDLAEHFLKEIEANTAESDRLKTAAEELSLKKDGLKKLYDKEYTDFERLSVRGEETEETFCMCGWVRYDKEELVKKAVASVTDAYELSFREPEDGEIPPSVTVNNKIVEPYEAITNLYSRPAPTGIDPNTTMAPFYFIFFGMMLSDAGYGVVLTIIMLLVGRVFKDDGMAGKLSKVIFMGALSTIMWGAMFGGWFGVEYKPLLFVPMNEPLKMLVLCYTLGAVHLSIGMIVKMYMEIKRGNLFSAIVDQLSWLVMLAGMVLYVALPDSIAGKYMALSGMATILLFAGREHSNILKRLLGGVTSLYNITGYLSDILSYSRLFALGLATGVIGMVINTIAEMIWNAGPIGQVAAVIVLLGGHTFNIAVNVLGAYVHTSRLQFIEFFSKFYEPGGKEFKPLAFRTKYINILK